MNSQCERVAVEVSHSAALLFPRIALAKNCSTYSQPAPWRTFFLRASLITESKQSAISVPHSRFWGCGDPPKR